MVRSEHLDAHATEGKTETSYGVCLAIGGAITIVLVELVLMGRFPFLENSVARLIGPSAIIAGAGFTASGITQSRKARGLSSHSPTTVGLLVIALCFLALAATIWIYEWRAAGYDPCAIAGWNVTHQGRGCR